MAGLIELANVDKKSAMQQFGSLARLEQQRNLTNDNIQQQKKQDKKSAIGSAIGLGVAGFQMGGPVGGAIGLGVGLLGSLF